VHIICVQLSYTAQNSFDNLSSYPPDSIIAQMLFIGGEGVREYAEIYVAFDAQRVILETNYWLHWHGKTQKSRGKYKNMKTNHNIKQLK